MTDKWHVVLEINDDSEVEIREGCKIAVQTTKYANLSLYAATKTSDWVDEDDYRYALELRAIDLENEKIDSEFSTLINFRLRRATMVQLRDFLTFLLTLPPLE